MEILGQSFQGTIEDILNLESFSEDRCYSIDEIEMFNSISNLDTWGMDMETEAKLTERDIIKDLTNDCRSRQLSVLIYEDIPFGLYQYIGKGNVENEVIFNKEVYLKLLKDYMNEFIEKKNNIEVVDMQYEYTARNYDFGVFYIEENAITSICKTKINILKK